VKHRIKYYQHYLTSANDCNINEDLKSLIKYICENALLLLIKIIINKRKRERLINLFFLFLSSFSLLSLSYFLSVPAVSMYLLKCFIMLDMLPQDLMCINCTNCTTLYFGLFSWSRAISYSSLAFFRQLTWKWLRWKYRLFLFRRLQGISIL